MTDKRPTVSNRLATVERLLALDTAALLKEKDAFSLNDQVTEDQLIQETEEGDIRQALSRPEIRRVFLRFVTLGGLMDSDSDPNATIMAHHTGRRSLALDVFNALSKVDPAWYWQASKEAKSNAKSKEKQNAD